MVSTMMKRTSNSKSAWLCVSVAFWMILCLGLLFTIYYGQFQVEINLMMRNTNNSYLAAVVDYRGYYFPNNYQGAATLNLYQYAFIIEQTSRYLVDIVVFPECGLFMCGLFPRNVVLNHAVSVPSAEELAIPCDDYIKYDDVISKLSCAAKAGNIYVAVQVWEKFNPANGTDDDILLYNTVVVFDRRGTIIARYRKYNLFLERWVNGVNQTKEVELVTFKTDFNETFGIMNCYDILFKDPGVTLVKEKHVTSMIYSASFIASLPFLATSAVEAGWSYAMDVNLLASSLPNDASAVSSNIFFGRKEQLNTYVMDYGFSKIIIGVVPKNGAKCLDDGDLLNTALPKYSAYGPKETLFGKEPVINSTTMKSLFNIGPNVNQNIAMNLQKNSFYYGNAYFDCTVSVIWRNNNVTIKPNYQLVGYSGVADFTIASVRNYVEMCGLVMCSKKQNKYCMIPPEFEDASKITIESLNIVAMSRKNISVTVPLTLDSELVSMNAAQFSFSSFVTNVNGRAVKMMEMNLRKPADNVVTFAMFTLPEKSNPLRIDQPSPNMLSLF